MAQTKFSWDAVKEKYKVGDTVQNGLYVNAASIKRTVKILSVDDECIHFKWGVVRDGIVSRSNMELMLAKMDNGEISKEELEKYDIVDIYRDAVADEEPLIACIILRDMGAI